MRGVQGPRARGARRRGPAPAPPPPRPRASGARGRLQASLVPAPGSGAASARLRPARLRFSSLPPPLSAPSSPGAAPRGRSICAESRVRRASPHTEPGRRQAGERGPRAPEPPCAPCACPLRPAAALHPTPRPGAAPRPLCPAPRGRPSPPARPGGAQLGPCRAQSRARGGRGGCGGRASGAGTPRPAPELRVSGRLRAFPTDRVPRPRGAHALPLRPARSAARDAALPAEPNGRRPPRAARAAVAPPGLWVPRPQGGWIRSPGPRCAAAPGVGPVNSAGSALARGFSAAESEVTLAAGVLSLAAARALQSCWGARGRLRAGREPRPGRGGGPPSALEPAQLPPRNQGGRAAVPGLPAPQGRWQRPPVGEASSRAPGLRAGVRVGEQRGREAPGREWDGESGWPCCVLMRGLMHPPSAALHLPPPPAPAPSPLHLPSPCTCPSPHRPPPCTCPPLPLPPCTCSLPAPPCGAARGPPGGLGWWRAGRRPGPHDSCPPWHARLEDAG
ncbi:uncharacterized protein LOC144316582 [Canis aureus]